MLRQFKAEDVSCATVTGLDGTTRAQLASFYGLPSQFTGGVRVGYSGSFKGRAAILTAAGPGGAPQVTRFDGLSLAVLGSFFACSPQFAGGVFVAGG